MNLNRLQFSIDIQAEKTRIWQALWENRSYREWAAVFYEGNYLVADNWEEGSKVWFLAPDQSGIYSIIDTHIPNQMIQFKHLGNVLKGEEQAIDDETKAWSGATESYTLTEGTDSYTLTIDIDVMDEHLDFMTRTLPKALKKVKGLAESPQPV